MFRLYHILIFIICLLLSVSTYGQSKLLEKKLAKIDSISQPKEWIEMAFDLAYEYDGEGVSKKTYQLYKKAERIAKRNKLKELEQAAIIWQARILFYDGKQNESLLLLNKIYKEIDEDNLEMKANALRFIGSNNVYLGNYAEAYNAQMKALKLYETLKDSAMVIRIKYNVGNNFHYQKQYQLALQNFQDALDISTAIDLPFGQMKAYGALGNVYTDMDSFEVALKYYELTIALAEELEDITTKGWTLVNLAFIQDNVTEALANVLTAKDIAEETADIPLKGFALEGLGKVYSKMKRYDEAIKAVNESLKIAKETDNRSDFASIYKTMADIYYEKGDYSNYKKYIDEHIDIKEALFTEELLSNLTNLSQSFEVQKVEQEKEIELLTKDKHIERIRSYLTIAGVLILFLSLFLMYMQNKNQKDKNAILTQKNAEITKQNEDLALANQDLEKYAYIISHDLREPLRNISGFTTLIKRKLKNLNQDDEDLNEYMDFVVNNTNQMNELLIELLEYSKLSFKNQEIETVNLTEVVQDVLISQKAEIAAANVEIILPEFPEISYNSKQMFNIFDNLINNAIKYKATSRNLIIEINIADKDAFYEFSIKDNGIGIEAEFFEKIFTIFQRLHDRGKYTGSGIGLATCRKIIESRGGKIWVESVINQGSTFHFTVPKIIQTLH